MTSMCLNRIGNVSASGGRTDSTSVPHDVGISILSSWTEKSVEELSPVGRIP